MSHDRQLQQAVIAELSWEPSINAAHIGVSADHGVVTLTGHVDSYPQKQAAESAALRVKGTSAIAEEITVRLPIDTNRTDAEIAAAAVDRLAWDSSVPRDRLQVRVAAGWVTLTGQLDWRYQQEAAESDIGRLHGVIGVSNQTTLKAKLGKSAEEAALSDQIRNALTRARYFDPAAIFVSDIDGQVRLSGTVRSPNDRVLAAATAWAAPGVTSVVNAIEVV